MAVEKVIVELDPETFGVEPNVGVMHQVVNAQLAARRAGTHSTKTRSEVRGGGAKPWKQKGTGRARAGSTRSPIWIGGGIAHGPKPRDYAQRTNKKMKQLALRSATVGSAHRGGRGSTRRGGRGIIGRGPGKTSVRYLRNWSRCRFV